MNTADLLKDRIARAAWRHRFRPAISGEGHRASSHLGLYLRAKKRALRIQAEPFAAEGPVALRFPKGADLIEHLVGVVLAGRAYVCLEPKNAGADEMRQLDRLGVRLVVHGRDLAPAKSADPAKRKFLSAIRGPGWLTSLRRLERTAPQSCCALVRTSGTSGEPCGVWQEAAAILHHAEWTIASQRIDARSRLSWVAAPGVAAAHSHLFAALLSGACLCPFEPAKHGLAAMTRWMRRERITHLHLTPTLLRAWLDSLADGSEFPDLRCVKLGGEPARAADARLLRRKLGASPRLLNGLGMSEASGNLALCEITPTDERGDGLLPVGFPIDRRVVLVESTPGTVAAFGETGEIVVRDQWVSPGYEPAGARDTIRATEQLGIRELRTGDAGRWDTLGRLVHLGRLDRRIRVRGMTVDLTELEARLAGLPGIAQVATVAEPSGTGYRVALVLKPDDAAARRTAEEFLNADSGPRIRPARVAFVAEIPRKPNGKRDDAALLENWPEEEKTRAWSGCEIYVRDAWTRVLGHAEFGPGDEFARVGGDSLSAMNLAVELARLAHREVGMADLVGLPTVAAQARALETRKLGRVVNRPTRDTFHIEWMSVPASSPRRCALVHPGGYTKEADVWIASALMSGLGGDTSLLVAKANIEDRRIDAPRDWDEMVTPLMRGALTTERPLLIGVCLGSMVIADLAARLTEAGRKGLEIILLDPWTPGLGRSAAGLADRAEHPKRIREYFALFKNRDYAPMPALRHVILAGDDSHFEARRNYWRALVPSPTHLHVVRGDHMSFLREHRDATARKLAKVVGEKLTGHEGEPPVRA